MAIALARSLLTSIAATWKKVPAPSAVHTPEPTVPPKLVRTTRPTTAPSGVSKAKIAMKTKYWNLGHHHQQTTKDIYRKKKNRNQQQKGITEHNKKRRETKRNERSNVYMYVRPNKQCSGINKRVYSSIGEGTLQYSALGRENHIVSHSVYTLVQ